MRRLTTWLFVIRSCTPTPSFDAHRTDGSVDTMLTLLARAALFLLPGAARGARE